MSESAIHTECLLLHSDNESVMSSMRMVQMPPLDYGENLSKSDGSDSESITTEDECAVDGNVQPPIRVCLMKTNECTVLIQSLHQVTINPDNITRRKRNAACMKPSTSGEITIYYYKSTLSADFGRGIPVALNITNSNWFLKCEFKEDVAVLSVECCEKSLDQIYLNDPITWPFIFYLSCTKDDWRHFESAKYKGWFIRAEARNVSVDKNRDPENFSFRMFPSRNVTKSK